MRKNNRFKASGPLCVVFLFCGLFASSGIHAADNPVSYRYLSASGQDIRLEIVVAAPSPASLIVSQVLPDRILLEQSNPRFQKYNPAQGEVSWLFTDLRPGSYQLSMRLATPVAQGRLRGEIRYKDPGSGRMVQLPTIP